MTAEPHGNRNYASVCICKLASILQSNGIVVCLFTVEGNAPVIRVYERLDFRKVRRAAFADFTVPKNLSRANLREKSFASLKNRV